MRVYNLFLICIMYYFPFQIAPAGSLPQTSLPLTAAQLQQLQTGAIMQLNQKVFIILLSQFSNISIVCNNVITDEV